MAYASRRAPRGLHAQTTEQTQRSTCSQRTGEQRADAEKQGSGTPEAPDTARDVEADLFIHLADRARGVGLAAFGFAFRPAKGGPGVVGTADQETLVKVGVENNGSAGARAGLDPAQVPQQNINVLL